MDTFHETSTSSSGSMGVAMQQPGQRDNIFRLKADLNEKDMELIELREQHMQLVARSQEARENWEAALLAKDRAIAQLEDALDSRERSASELIATQESTWLQRERVLDVSLQEMRAKNTALQQELSEARRQASMAEELARRRLTASSSGRSLSITDDADAGSRKQFAALHEESRLLKAANQELHSKIAELEAELATARQGSHELQGNITKLQQALEQSPSSNGLDNQGTSRSEQQAAHARLQQAEASVQHLQQELQRLHSKLVEKANTSKKYKEAVRALKGRVSQAEASNQLLQQEVQQLRAVQQSGQAVQLAGGVPDVRAATQLRADLSNLQARLSEKDVMLAQAVQALEQAEKLRKEAMDQAIAHERSAYEAAKKLKDLEEAANRSSQKLQHCQEQLRFLESCSQQLQTDRDAAAKSTSAALHRALEAEKRAEEQAQQAAALERRLEVADQKLADLKQHFTSLQQQYDKAESTAAELEDKASTADRRAKQAEARTASLERRVQEAESWSQECEQRCKQAETRVMDSDQRTKDLERRARSAEIRNSELEQKLSEQSGQIATLERRLQEGDNETTIIRERLRRSEAARHDLEQATRAAEAAAKQVQAERDALVNDDTRRSTDSKYMKQLRAEIQKLQSAQDEGGSAKTVAMAARLASLEELLSLRERTIVQLREGRAAAEADHQKEIRSMMEDLRAKNLELVEAEQRFNEFESLMQRIAGRLDVEFGSREF